MVKHKHPAMLAIIIKYSKSGCFHTLAHEALASQVQQEMMKNENITKHNYLLLLKTDDEKKFNRNRRRHGSTIIRQMGRESEKYKENTK